MMPKRLLSTVTGSFINPLNIVELLTTLLQIGKDALRYGRVVGALYRDTVELEVQLWLATPAIDNRPPPFRVTEFHVAGLREVYSRRNDDLATWLGTMAALRGQGLEPMAQRRFFVELGGLMSYICNLITKEPDALRTCMAGLPKTLPAPVAVLTSPTFSGLGTAVTTRPGRSGGSEDKPKPPVMMASAITPNEVIVTVADGRKFQKALCVRPSDGFDEATRDQLKNFNRAFLFPTDSNAVGQIAADADLQNLRQAQQRSPDCAKAGFRNGFEVGLVARLERAGTPIQAMLNKALLNKTLNDAGIAPLSTPAAPVVIDEATRKAIGFLAGKYGLTTGSEITRDFYVKLNPER